MRPFAIALARPGQAEVRPERKRAQVKRRDWPDKSHHRHLLRMADQIDRDDEKRNS